MQLQDIRPQCLDDVAERRVVGVDRKRDFYGAALDPTAEVARRLQAEVPRRRRKEHESHHIRTGFKRRIERFVRGEAANFDEQGHGRFA